MQLKNQMQEAKVVVGVDVHPDDFAAAAFKGTNAVDMQMQFQHTKKLSRMGNLATEICSSIKRCHHYGSRQ
jgi:hypothetical protein